jgi:ferritin
MPGHFPGGDATMLDPKLVKALNDQINKELQAWYAYLSMAAYCDTMHLTGFAAFMEAQSREEQVHAHRLIRYVLDRGGRVDLLPISPPGSEYRGILDIFVTSLEQERGNTRAIYELYDLAKGLNDYATVAHLQWFLDEQVEEEKTMSDAVGLLKFAGDDKSALLSLNREFGSRRPEGGKE